MTAVFADTFYFLALLNEKDDQHEKAVALSASIRRPVVTTAWILTELADGLSDTPGRVLFEPFVERLRSNSAHVSIVPPTEELFDRAIKLYRDRNDKGWSLTDCVSFITMKERQLLDALTADTTSNKPGSSR